MKDKIRKIKHLMHFARTYEGDELIKKSEVLKILNEGKDNQVETIEETTRSITPTSRSEDD